MAIFDNDPPMSLTFQTSLTAKLTPAQLASMFARSSLSATELRRIAIELQELAREKKEEEKEKEREEYQAKMDDIFRSGFKMMDEHFDKINETLRKSRERIAKQTEALREIGDRRLQSNRETLELEEESKKDV